MKMNTILRRSVALAFSFVLALALRAEKPAPGQAAPDFTLKDNAGQSHTLSAFKGKTVVLEWINHGCPFVVKHYGSGNMQKTQKAAVADGVVWLSVCSSAPGKQGYHTPEEWTKVNAEKGAAAAAVLLDVEGKVGRLYGATNTPEIFIINAAGTIVYAGAIDSVSSANPADIAKATNYVSAALADLKAGRAVATPVTKPYGCSVKY